MRLNPVSNSVFIDIIKEVYEKNSIFYVLGWMAVAFFFSWGMTSPGLLFLLIHHIYFELIKDSSSVNLFNIDYDKSLFVLINLLLVWALFSSFFAVNKSAAFLSTLGFILIFYIFLFGVFKLINYRKFILRILIPVTVAGISISSIYTIYNYFILGPGRSFTIFANVNDSGSIFIMCTGLLLGYLGYYRKKQKYLLLIPLMTTITALFLTFSRGAMVGVTAGIIFYLLFSFLKSKNWSNILIMLIVLLLLFTFVFNHTPLRERVESIFSIDNNMARIIILQGTINMIQDNYILGVGPGNFPFVYPEYKEEAERTSERPFAHNIFFNMFAELGIIGGLLYIAIIGYLFKAGYIISKLNSLNRGVFAAFLGVMVHEQFDCITLGLETGISFWILAGFIGVLYYKYKKCNV